MPKKQLQNTQKASEYFAQANEHLRDNFILYGQPGPEGITLLAPESYTSLRLKREVDDLASADVAKPIHLTKTVIAEHNFEGTETKSQLAVVNEDGIYDTLVWTTTPANIKKALRSGVFQSSGILNPLAKVIAQLGDYKRQVFSRSVEDNYIVAHNQEKLDMVEVSQLCVEALENLHCGINNYNDGDSPQGNVDSLIKKLNELQKQFQKIKTENLKKRPTEPYETLNDGITQLEKDLENYKKNLQVLLDNKNSELTRAEIEDILRPYANPFQIPDLSLQHFLQSQLNSMMSTAVEANYAVSGLFQDGSNLQKYLTSAQISAEKFTTMNVDYDNPVTPEHAFDFSAKANAQGLVTINFKNYNFVPDNNLELAKQAVLIHRVDSNRPLFSSTDRGPGLFGMRWDIDPLAPFNWLLNGSKDIISSIADTFYIAGKAAYDSVQVARGIEITPPRLPGGSTLLRKTDLNETKYAKLAVAQGILSEDAPITVIPYQSLIQRAYTAIKNIGARYIVDPFISLSNFVVNESIQFKTPKRIYYDFTIGTKPADDTEITLLLNKRLSEMTANREGNAVMQAALLESFNELAGENEISYQAAADNYHRLTDTREISSYKELAEKFAALQETMPQAAVTPYTLTPDNPGDLVSWAVNDFTRGLTSVFSEKIYRQHPIAGLAFTVAASTAGPMLIPALAHNIILGAINQHFSVPLADLVLGKTTGLMPTFSTAILQGQLAYLGTDAFNGSDSLLRNGLQSVLENPVIAGVLGLAAVGFGYALAYKLDIPFLSEAIADETSKAAFPYFQLGVAGAKVAAIMIESTINLHGAHHPSSNDVITSAIDKTRGKIEESIRDAYMQRHNIENSNSLKAADKEQIKLETQKCCDAFKKALKQPELAAQLNQMSQTIAALIGAPKPVDFMGVAPIVSDEKSQNQLLHFLQRRLRRQQIALLDPAVLSERDKYTLIHYVAQNYGDDPDYVASVRNRLASNTGRKPGPLGQTLNIVLAYPGDLIRAAIATVRSFGYNMGSLASAAVGASASAADLTNTANRVFQPAVDFGRKIKNDLGLLVKATASALRIAWGIVGGVLLVPTTLILSPLALVSRGLGAVAGLLNLDKARAFFKRSDSPRKMFAGVNKVFFAPGLISQAIDSVIGAMRYDAGGKNINLATEDMDAVEFDRRILNPVTRPEIIDPAISRRVSTEVPLKKTVLNIMQDELGKHSSLKPLVDSENFDLLIGRIYAELSKGKPLVKFYEHSREDETFRKDLKIALFAVNEKINQLENVSFEERKTYQDQIMDLLYLRKRDPLTEFKEIYTKFAACELSRPESPELQEPLQKVLMESYNRLIVAQDAMKSLETSYNASQPRPQAVVNFLREHDCLTLQVVRETTRLKKIIADNRAELKTTKTLDAAETMLQAFGMAHKAARVACHRLAIYAPIRETLTQLHPARQAPAKIKPLVLPAAKSVSAHVEQKPGQDWPELATTININPYLSLLQDDSKKSPAKKKPRTVKIEEPAKVDHSLTQYKMGSGSKHEPTSVTSKNESKISDTESKRRNGR